MSKQITLLADVLGTIRPPCDACAHGYHQHCGYRNPGRALACWCACFGYLRADGETDHENQYGLALRSGHIAPESSSAVN